MFRITIEQKYFFFVTQSPPPLSPLLDLPSPPPPFSTPSLLHPLFPLLHSTEKQDAQRKKTRLRPASLPPLRLSVYSVHSQVNKYIYLYFFTSIPLYRQEE
jgi:hypothetical protein